LFGIVHKLDESVQIEKSVCHMLGYDLAMEIDEDLSVGTHHPLILVISIQLSTVNAPVEDCCTLSLPI